MRKKSLAVLLVLAMLLGLFPAMALAGTSDPAVPDRITVTREGSGPVAVPELGGTATVRLTADAVFDGASGSSPVTGQAVWSVKGSPAGVSVRQGVVTLSSTAPAGEVTIRAACQGKSGEITLTLTKEGAGEIAGMEISGPDTISVPPQDGSGSGTYTYTAAAYDKYGQAVDPLTVDWSCSPGSGLSIDSSGLLTVASGAGTGSCVITAAAGSLTASKTVTLQKADAVPTRIEIDLPEDLSIPTAGIGERTQRTVPLSATVYDQYGEVMPGRKVSWSWEDNSAPAGVRLIGDGLLIITNDALNGAEGTLRAACGGAEATRSILIGDPDIEIEATIRIMREDGSFLKDISNRGTYVDTYYIPNGAEEAYIRYRIDFYDQYGKRVALKNPTVSLDQDSFQHCSQVGGIENLGRDAYTTIPSIKVTEINFSGSPTVTQTLSLEFVEGGSANFWIISVLTQSSADAQVTISGSSGGKALSISDCQASLTYDPAADQQTIQLTAAATSGFSSTWRWTSSNPGVLEITSGQNSDTATITVHKAGSALISVQGGSGNYSCAAGVLITVEPYDLSSDLTLSLQSAASSPYVYDGTVKVTGVDVGWTKGTPLSAGSDFTVVWNPSSPPVTEAGTYSVTAAGIGNYTGSVTRTFSVEKAEPVVDNVQLPQGTLYTTTDPASVVLGHTGTPGTVRLTGVTRFTAGEAEYRWEFTPEDTRNYKTTTGTIQLSVEKATLTGIALTALPADITYAPGETLNPTGMRVTALYDKGGNQTLDNSGLTFTYQTGDAFSPGDTQVTLSYTDAETGQTFSAAVAGLSVSKAVWPDQSVSLQLPCNQTGLQTVPLADLLPADCGAAAVLHVTAASEVDGFFQWAAGPGDIVFRLGSGLTNAAVGKTGTITATVATEQYADFQVTVTVRLVSTGSGSSDDDDDGYGITIPASTSIRGGSITVSPRSADKGDTVTITVKPDDGYVLNELSVSTRAGAAVDLTRKNSTQYTFKMPGSSVVIDVSFVREGTSAEMDFTDVAESFWAVNEIRWAFENGYMNGTSATTFNPNGTVNRQQVWMILARMAGADPANMAEAKSWAVANGISDGTNPTGAVTRQQLVALLYRFASQNGYDVSNKADLSSYPDAASVASYAAEPMAWAVANSIIGGTTQGTLNAAGNSNRAQLAVILWRFYQTTAG